MFSVIRINNKFFARAICRVIVSEMPTSVFPLFAACGLSITGQTLWNTSPDCTDACVYAVCLSGDPKRNAGLLDCAPIDENLLRAWIAHVPTFSFDGRLRPDASEVAAFLQGFWLPDENILYIGKATCLRDRLGQYFGHKLGNRSPHKGGHWLKTLSNLAKLHVFFARCNDADQAEEKEAIALDVFEGNVSEATERKLLNPQITIPFANRKNSRGALKQNRIRGDVLARRFAK